jgi:hypothetical protein
MYGHDAVNCSAVRCLSDALDTWALHAIKCAPEMVVIDGDDEFCCDHVL